MSLSKSVCNIIQHATFNITYPPHRNCYNNCYRKRITCVYMLKSIVFKMKSKNQLLIFNLTLK